MGIPSVGRYATLSLTVLSMFTDMTFSMVEEYPTVGTGIDAFANETELFITTLFLTLNLTPNINFNPETTGGSQTDLSKRDNRSVTEHEAHAAAET